MDDNDGVITEEGRRAARDLQELIAVVENAPDILSRFGPDLRYRFINRTAERATGIPRADFLGRTFREVGFPDPLCQLWEDSLRRTFATGETDRITFSVPHPPPVGLRHYEGTSIAEVGPDGTVASVFTVTRDVTEQTAALASVQESAGRLRLALAAARMGSWDWDVQTGELTWAGHLEEVHGMEPDTFDGRFETFLSRIYPDDREQVLAKIGQALETGEPYRIEFRCQFPDDTLHWVAGEGRAEHDAEGRPLRMIGMGWDITLPKRAEEQLRQRAEREALLNRIAQTLRGTTDPAVIQSIVTTALGEALGADRCYFVAYDLPHDRLRVEVEWRQRPDLAPFRGAYRISATGVSPAELYGTHGRIVVNDVRSATSLSPEGATILERMGLRAGLSVALYDNDELVASLGVAMTEQARVWTNDEIELVQSVVTLVRSAIETARARVRERNIADRLQDALRPSAPIAVPGLALHGQHRPALAEASVGGDFFDVFALENGCYALVVADLSGKGLAAAAQIATVRHMLRTLLYLPRTTVATAITMLNTMLTEHDLLTGFSTLFAGVYDVHQRTLTYVSCGQEPALLWRAATGAIQTLEPTGPVLGAFPGVVFPQQTLSLAAGDIFALFTDGLTEAGLDRKSLLGMDGVTELFQSIAVSAAPGQNLSTRLIESVEKSVTPSGMRDDVCLLTARVV